MDATKDLRLPIALAACLTTILLVAAPNLPLRAQPSRGALARGELVITNVNVVPMTRDTVLANQTIVIRDGRIAAIGVAGQVGGSAGSRRVDGGGRYVIPGLADMHTHLFSDGDVADSVAPYELGVMLALGVTTARLMIGTAEQLVLRRQVASGEIAGPQLWVASPHLTGRNDANARVVTQPEEARAAVREYKAAGYDLIKVTNWLTPEVWEAIIDEASRQSIRVDGHVVPDVGVPRALAVGQNIQHLDSYFEGVLADSSPIKASVTQFGLFQLRNWTSLDHIDTSKIARLAGATAQSGVYSTPTLHVFNKAFAIGQTEEEARARPDWKVLSPSHRSLYLRALASYWSPAGAELRTEARRRKFVEVRNAIVKAIADSGGASRLLAGSDSPEWMMAYGWTLHRELEAFANSNLTPFEALATATRNPAEFLGASAEWGTIEVGKRADLVIVDGNPLEDIRNTLKIESVVVGGRLIDRAERERMIEAAAMRMR